MIFSELYRLFKGYVRFTASGGFGERFINLCSQSRIVLWNLSTEKDCINACTEAKHYLKIKSCALRSGMTTKIISKHGLPFFINRYRHRTGLLYGFVFGVCFLAVTSTMVWTIDISGNNAVTDEQILSVLDEAGIRCGTLRKNIDAPSTRFYAMSKLPELSYITVNVIGSCVQVKVSEHVGAPNKIDKSEPCDVVSTVDGQIAAIEVYQGTKLHNVGEAVRAGEVLAGGFIELGDGSVKFKHAEAYALLRTNIDFDVSVTADTVIMKHETEKREITLHIMGLDIPLHKEESGTAILTRRHSLVIGGVEMPFGLTSRIYRTYTHEKKTLDSTQLALSAAESYLITKAERLADSQICSQQIDIEKSDEKMKISNSTLAEISAGAAKEMLTESLTQ